ncbi:MAG: methylmalonyl-CoA mutase [Deltaproteobacteria bacterium]|nr:methylmalonyl-CoA mutase [Deltaproteobacteria bacterium]
MEDIKKVEQEKHRWKEKTLQPALERFKLKESPTQFYSPSDLEDGFNFLDRVGFPGQYPFTAGTYPTFPYRTGERGSGGIPQAKGLVRAGRYSGYGAPEDTRDYYLHMKKLGARTGPNIAFDLPTQCGYDSDSPMASGEVGRVGVAVDTLRDMEVIFEAFSGENDIDRTASNFTINAPANIIMAMYMAMAEKRGISWDKLRATPQNDILKEFVARGTYIFPPRPSIRMFRDSLVFFAQHLPNVNITSIGGYHIREAGATREQDLAFSMAIGTAYLQEGVNAGLPVDSFAPRFSFNAFGGSMEFFKEIAFHRAARRMWAKLLKEKFGARNERSMTLRIPMTVYPGNFNCTVQRPLNNLVRSVVGGIAGALTGGAPNCYPPFDEPLGLGWSLEAIQLSEDAARILQHEARLADVMDPLAGSYYVESLTNQIENAAWAEFDKIQSMGGAVAAIESGYMQREVARSAYERQKKLEEGKELIVGVNCYLGEHELEVSTTRLVPHPYDANRRDEAERLQLSHLKEVKEKRDNKEVARLLKELKAAAQKEEVNLILHFFECVKAYATLQEMCDVLKEVFGEYRPATI